MSITKETKMRRRAERLILQRLNEALDTGVCAKEIQRLAESYDLLRTIMEREGE